MLWKAADDTQVFVTTHSLPLVDELLERANGRDDDLRACLLHREGSQVNARSFSAARARAPGHKVIAQALDPRFAG